LGSTFFAGTAFISAGAFAADDTALVSQFWQAESDNELETLRNELLAGSADISELYDRLKQGPDYASDVEVGELVYYRTAADGTEFPFMVYIPETYDPEDSYAVEFILHGGVGRPKPEPGDNFWQRSYDRVAQSDRIIVVPSSWRERFWWEDSQAENLPAILRMLKQRYNIDENRVTMTGISDGGTGAYFFAFKQPTEWAAFLPYIGHPGVLRNPQSGGGYRLYFENLMGKPLYIVNGENDRLYPAASLQSFIAILEEEGVSHTWRVIEEGGHNTRWLPDELDAIEQFKLDNPRDPFPESLQWVVDRTDRYNRNHWIRVDSTEIADNPSLLKVDRLGNKFIVVARGVKQFTLLLNPEEVDFTQNFQVDVNGVTHFDGPITQSKETLLNWAQQDLDRSMLITAELPITVQ
ncbi:MAG: hypothetical protein MI746_05935, partial [Pseudomonadales bacterium]|nr:hypothetical protein [Pseudomonadales bacterium]